MKTTTRTFSVIGYESASGIQSVLQKQVSNGVISRYAIMPHPEYIDSLTGELKKAHFHIYIDPIVTIDLGVFCSLFEYQDFSRNLNESGPTPCYIARSEINRVESVIDWLAYALHDKQYCEFKKLEQKPYYDLDFETILTNDKSFFVQVWLNFPRDKWLSPVAKIAKAISEGKRLIDFMDEERIPFNQFSSVERAWSIVLHRVDEAMRQTMETAKLNFESAKMNDTDSTSP